MREKYESLSAVVLRDLAKSRGLKNLSGLKKAELVELMLAEDERVEAQKAKEEKQTSGRENGRDDTKELDSGVKAHGIFRGYAGRLSDLSGVRIISREKTMSMCLRLRSADLT